MKRTVTLQFEEPRDIDARLKRVKKMGGEGKRAEMQAFLLWFEDEVKRRRILEELLDLYVEIREEEVGAAPVSIYDRVTFRQYI